VPRFADAYRIQMREWVNSVATGQPVGASAWDGYVATAVAEQVVTALQTGSKAQLFLGARPALYT
jgi:myo-inositol 2-dehydrogenase/D-chiro-inositol 1-dehydrogenase